MRSEVIDRLLKSTPKEVEIFVEWYSDLLILVNEILKHREEPISPLHTPMILSWEEGDFDFSLRSIAKLSVELGHDLIKINTLEKEDIQ